MEFIYSYDRICPLVFSVDISEKAYVREMPPHNTSKGPKFQQMKIPHVNKNMEKLHSFENYFGKVAASTKAEKSNSFLAGYLRESHM